jgi:ribose 5-phosphate isomerase A
VTANTTQPDALKQAAGRKAAEYVRDGMTVGLGTGSTAKHLVLALGERVRAGLRVTGVPTSRETAELATAQGIPLLAEDALWPIDLAIDGADQVDPNLQLIKGGGGALLKEKIIAAAATQFIVIIDDQKQVPVLGGSFPLPVEVIPFGWKNTARHLEHHVERALLRMRNGQVFVTEAGHYILDLHIARIDHPAQLEAALHTIPGVVETGLFVGRTHVLIVGTATGVEVRHAAP